jgi:hypothetical protein
MEELQWEKEYVALQRKGDAYDITISEYYFLRQTANIFVKHKSFFKNILAEQTLECFGYYDTYNETFTIEACGDEYADIPELVLPNVPWHPTSDGLLNWHTHPRRVSERLQTEVKEVESVTAALPSNIDLETSLKANLYYKERIWAVIVSDEGISQYRPSTQMLRKLCFMNDKLFEEVMNHTVRNNIAISMGETFAKRTPLEQIAEFDKSIKNITNENEGFVFFFTPWRL